MLVQLPPSDQSGTFRTYRVMRLKVLRKQILWEVGFRLVADVVGCEMVSALVAYESNCDDIFIS